MKNVEHLKQNRGEKTRGKKAKTKYFLLPNCITELFLPFCSFLRAANQASCLLQQVDSRDQGKTTVTRMFKTNKTK